MRPRRRNRTKAAKTTLPTEPNATTRKVCLPYPKDADGKPLCRWCRGPVVPPRKSWCGDKCVEEYRSRYDAAYQRQLVFRRDRGVCAVCHLDTDALRKRIMALRPRREAQLGVLVEAGFRPTDLKFNRRGLRSLWEADHIVPVVEGGGGTGVDNLRTACLLCHREATRELMARRRAAKKAAKT